MREDTQDTKTSQNLQQVVGVCVGETDYAGTWKREVGGQW